MKEKHIIIILFLCMICFSVDLQQSFSPSNVVRQTTFWKQCSNGKESAKLTIWPTHQSKRNFTISINQLKWMRFQGNVNKISWKCSEDKQSNSMHIQLKQNQWLTVLYYNQTKQNQQVGKISFNIWKQTNYTSSIPFTSHSEGYACFKIPTLLKTAKGTLIVFAQARKPGCDDFDRTDLVYKRSYDQGKTWSPLKQLVSVTQADKGLCGHALVIGNISPVQLRNDSKKHPGRILAPYTRNNFKLWITYSDDDGQSWQGNSQIPDVSQTSDYPDCNRNMSYFGYNIDQLKLNNLPAIVRYFQFVCKMNNPYDIPKWTSKLKAPWQFIGVGPSRSLQLKSGRVLVPGYFSPIRGLSQVPGTIPISQLYNNFNVGFVLISDDDGQKWRLGQDWPIGQGTNQHQLIQLDNGTILSNSRSLSMGSPQYRVQTLSFTQGQTFTKSYYTNIPSPFAGCQGSTVGGQKGKIFVTSPNPQRGHSLLQQLTDDRHCSITLNGRQRLSLWASSDNGKTYQLDQIIDPGLSAQTSVEFINGSFYLLYEQVDPLPQTFENILIQQSIRNLRVLVPTRFVYRQLSAKKKYFQDQ